MAGGGGGLSVERAKRGKKKRKKMSRHQRFIAA